MGAVDQRIAEITELGQQGLYLKAYAAAQALGPLETWQGTEARVLAGRLAHVLGAPRLGRVLHWLAWRDAPTDAKACYYRVLNVQAWRGPWRAWRLMERFGDLPDADDEIRSDWFALRAHVLAQFRDFDSAEGWLAQAEQLAPGRAWVQIERSSVLDAEDRHEEALAAARQALALRPWYRPAVQATAYHLVQLNRDDEALELLTQASDRLECGDLLAQLAALQTELKQYAEARASLQRAEQLLPLLSRDKNRYQAIRAQQADAAYYCGDFEDAARRAEEVKHPFFEEFARRLRDGLPDKRRVVLPVGFVRQHHVTCAPATLAMLSQYWSKPANHLEVAEEICYDGTPAASERKWAEQNGFQVVEFRATWDSAVALLDRGVPFTLNTVRPTSAHLQAAIGYDGCRGSFLIRDPSDRHLTEFRAVQMLEHFRSTGPRGMAMVPKDRAGLLASIELPEAELYDHAYRLERALQEYRRDAAGELLNRMCQLDPNHRLTIRARGSLAYYDGDTVNLLVSVERLLVQFPDDSLLLVNKLNCLGELGRREDRLALLERLSSLHDCEPLFWRRFAVELKDDARQHAKAEGLLRRALRYEPLDAESYQVLADILWEQSRRREALALYRLAACLDDKNESRVKAWFVASRCCGQTEAALRMVEDRFARFGALSGWPARTLCWAYEELDRAGEVFDVLQKAIALRPEDGDLLLFAADVHGRHGKIDEASAYLQRAQGLTRRTGWLRLAAYLAMYRGALREALEQWREVAEAEPLARDANEMVAQLLADLEGHAAALEHARRAVERFPHSYPLRVLLIEICEDEDATSLEAAVREFLEMHPVDPWARRELAISLIRQSRWDEAEEEAALACELEPSHPVGHMLRGRIHEMAGRAEAAKEAYRHAIRLSVDYEPAIGALVGACSGRAEREEEIRFVSQELVRQVIFGDGLLSFREQARTTLEPEALLAILREALAARPDLWHAYAALVRQLIEMQQADEAHAVAQAAVERFPLLPRTWFELASACSAQNDRQGEIEALGRALQINPGWGEASQQLAEAHLRRGDFAQARSVLEKAIAMQPRNAVSHGMLADALWRMDDREAALERLLHAVRLSPGYEWAWTRLRDWSAEMDRPEVAFDAARQLTETRPNEVRSWLMRAEVLRTSEHREECLDALRQALALNPRHLEACDMLASCLAEAGRHEEALAACRPAVFGDSPPLLLQGRAAELRARGGELEAAIAEMREVVAADPDYYWAWTRLADWYRKTEQPEEYLKAAEQMVRLAPMEPICWGYRGDARMHAGDPAGAASDFQHAMQLAPDYTFAAMMLFDLQLDAGQWDAAGETLLVAAPHVNQPTLLAEQVRLASRAGRLDDALAQFRTLSRCELSDPSPLREALKAMQANPWDAQIQRLLEEQLEQPEVSPQMGAVWVEFCIQKGRWGPCARRLRQLTGREDLWVAASCQFLLDLAEAGQAGPVQRYVRKYRDLLRARLATWAAAGQAYSRLKRSKASVRWLADWETRDAVTPEMLFPLAYNLWKLKRYAEAETVSRRVLEMPEDDTTPVHRFWLAVESLAEGRIEATGAMLDAIQPDALNDYYRGVYEMVCAAVAPIRTPGETPLPYREAKQRLRAALGERLRTFSNDSTLRRIYYLCRWQLARHYRRRLESAWARCELLFC